MIIDLYVLHHCIRYNVMSPDEETWPRWRMYVDDSHVVSLETWVVIDRVMISVMRFGLRHELYNVYR